MRNNSKVKCRRGVVAPLVALCIIALVSVVAIAIDGGLLLDRRRGCQAAADAAALAAAEDLYYNWEANKGLDSGNSASNAAWANAAANGYNNDGVTSIVTVNIPPTTGSFAGQAGYAEVIIQYNQPRGFSGIFASGDIPVKARAVARGLWVPFNNGIIVLHPTAPDSLFANGNGSTVVKGANLIVDSNNSQAAATVGNAVISDIGKATYIVGTNPGYSGDFNGTVLTGQQPVPDPLAYLPEPDPSTMVTQTVPIGSGNSVTLQPGRYVGGLSFSGQTSVTMQPGIYYMDGGGFSFSGQGSLYAAGVMVFCTGGISVTGLGSVTWSPPTTGIYKGISYFQQRSCTATAKVAGNGQYNVTGTFYVAGGLTDIQGNGDASVASQVVTLLMKSGGNGVTNINWSAGNTAPTRIISLVE
jgi:hypothetical protein